MQNPSYLIVGAGAIGSILAGHLAKAGHRVSVLARGRRARDIQQNGLRIRGLASFNVPVVAGNYSPLAGIPQVQLYTETEQLKSAGVLIVATKTPGTAALLETLRGLDVSAVLSVQNGLMKNALLSEAFGPEKLLGALANTSGELLASGEVNFTRNVNLLLGEPGGELSERAQTLAKHLNQAGVKACAVHNILSLEWSKFVNWVPLMLLSITTRANTWQFLSNRHSATLIIELVREVACLLNAHQLELIDDASLLPLYAILQKDQAPATLPKDQASAIEAVLAAGEHFRKHAPQHKMSALQDLLAGRALELDETLGHAVQRARLLQVDMPLLNNFYQLALAIDQSR